MFSLKEESEIVAKLGTSKEKCRSRVKGEIEEKNSNVSFEPLAFYKSINGGCPEP